MKVLDWRRIGWATIALFFLLFLATELTVSPHAEENRSLIWSPILFGLLPDIALLIGIGSDLDRGQLHPRAVWAYNLLHVWWLGPMLLLGGGLLAPHSPLWLGGLAWMSHIAIDRTLGFRPRDADGPARLRRQRPAESRRERTQSEGAQSTRTG